MQFNSDNSSTSEIYENGFNHTKSINTNRIDDDSFDNNLIIEILIVIFIIILWFLSIRKFVKQFDRLRNIHYREIPYSYRQQKLHTNIKIVKLETDSIIHSAPILTRSKSLTQSDQTHQDRSHHTRNSLRQLNDDQINNNNNNNGYNNIRNYTNNEPETNDSSTATLYKQHGNDTKTCKRPNSPLLLDLECSPKRFMRPSYEFKLITTTQSNSNVTTLIDPHLIPPIVRRSLLELHRKSVEQLSSHSTHSRSIDMKATHFIDKSKPLIVESPV